MPGQLDVPQAVFAKKNRLIADCEEGPELRVRLSYHAHNNAYE